MEKLDVIALGGNAILPAGSGGTITEQFSITQRTMDQIADLIESGRNVVLTHGNGPIVGNIVVRNEAAKDIIPPMPLDVCGADSQGGIGYMIQQTLRNILERRNVRREVVSLITQVLVSADDQAFKKPVKPIGPFYSKEEAIELEREKDWSVVDDGVKGYRRVVPSPRPLEIIELPVVQKLIEAGMIVITVGGGGIPVIRKKNRLLGTEAVIDKDLASSVLARDLRAERLLILTDVDAVYKGYGTPNAQPLRDISVDEAAGLLQDGEFPPGSMGSKIEAAVEFLRSGGKTVLICRSGDLSAALEGEKGTRIAGT
ncbi:MAG: carbamate kinase [Candidatus Latescibacteria bacterium]|nr:carbamate kinase [Candidatus Latescibacterota bacterium]NIM21643.1 carbamate kinase [Candidatus Latescibacterota bacterium]NIM64622.1 carbamate kinase [Candidatus Latescibacterota bacterium]NIO01137.1 carbamate kinase [Candidatus Latescibacterota bacterium]NIO27530.1 carbamate kinase [Candidatus Latescibacterota bacterium]